MTLNVALVISGDSSGARQAVQQTSADMRGLSGDARQMSSAITAANDQAAAASERVTRTLIGQTTAQRNLQAAVASFAGVRNPVDDASYRQRSADIAAYGNQLDQLRAKYNPLYAAEQAHIRNLAEIDRALRVGALGENEHAEAVRRAAAAYEMQVAGLDQVAAHALAAKLQLAEFQRQALAAREMQKADQAQVQVNQLLGVRDPSAMAGSARASAAAFLDFPEAAEGAKNIGLASHEMTNLTYQMNDIVMMLASGQSPFLMMMQQGSQITQIMGPRGLGQILPAIGQALVNLISPTTLLLAGVTAGGYAAYAAYRMVVPEVEELSTIMERHRDLLDSIKEGWRESGVEARNYAKESQTILMSQMRHQSDELQKRLNSAAQDIYKNQMGGAASPLLDMPQLLPEWAIGKSSTLGPIYGEIMKLNASAKEGAADFLTFRWELTRISNDTSLPVSIRKKADALRELTDEFARGQRQLLEYADAAKRFPTAMSVGRDMTGYGAWQNEQDGILKRMRRDHASELAAMTARSPAERAEAARQRAENEHKDESAPVRRLRIEEAAALELARAYHELDEAQRQRMRSLDETLASARLDVELIGTNAAETARLRMEHELTQQVRAAAADANIDADEKEIELIRQKSAEYGRLIALQSARELLRDQDEDMQRLRVEQALLGTSVAVRNRLTAQMEVELEIRRQGIDSMGEEAARLRSGAAALADYRTEIERQADAWDTVRNAGESAIDSIVDRLSNGDWQGALKALADEMQKTTMQMMVANPFKNAIFGTNNPTFADLGSNFFSRLFGGADQGAADAVSSILGGQSVASMAVNAGVVTINGGMGGLSDNISRLLTGANDNYAPGAVVRAPLAPASYGNDLAGNIRALAANIGANPRDLAALMSFESGFRPDVWGGAGGGHYGLIQAGAAERAAYGITPGGSLAQQFGGIEQFFKARGFKPGMSGLDLYSTVNAGSPGRYGASDALNGGTWGTVADKWNFQMGPHFAKADALLASSGKASAALDKLAGGSGTAAQGLNAFGTGLDKFGNALSQFPAAPGGGGGGGLLGSLLGGLSSAFAGTSAYSWLSANPGGYIGLYSDGGYTGPGGKFDPKGIVHAEEYVFSAEATRAMGVDNLDKLHAAARNGFAYGGYGNGARPIGGASGGGFGGVQVTFVNKGTPQQEIERKEEDDGNGGRRITFVLEDAQAAGINRTGSAPQRALRAMGVAPRVLRT